MQKTENYRHELKYHISVGEQIALRQRLRSVMRLDPHVRDDGLYTIQSIYFDNYKDKALREKICGVQQREKFRIRYYNNDLSFVTLEKKLKHNELCMKFDAQLTEKEFHRILCKPGAWMLEHPEPLIRELYCKMNIQQLRPRVLISYVREPYIYHAGNVRVTFDSDIRTSLFCSDFAGRIIGDISATNTPSDIIMEVKYDSFLPEIIDCLLQIGSLRRNSFSKYGASRRFG